MTPARALRRSGLISALSTVVVVGIITGCASTGTPATTSPFPLHTHDVTATLTPLPAPSVAGHTGAPGASSLVIVGRILTMDEPPLAEALLIEDGFVTAIGSRGDVLARASDGIPIIDTGDNVAYPGFIDAHAHWIGDREYYGIETTAEAMDEAIRRGWTSISEQWNDEEKLEVLLDLAANHELPLRVDAYLALNGVHPGEHYGDWYTDREPKPMDDHLAVQGLKIHLDNGAGALLLWEPADLTETIGRANAAGWQVSVHAVSTEAMEMVLDAFEAAIGSTGPNPLHHRIEHAIQVTDEQLARMVAMDLVPVIQLDGVATDWVSWTAQGEGDYFRDYEDEDVSWLGRWRDFVDAGLHVAGSSDAPWFFTEAGLTEDISRPVDAIAGGMEGHGRSFPETRPWALDQLLTAEQGLRAVTVDAAYALGDESRRGHLAPGTLGDVTILSGDVVDATPVEIRAFEVVATVVSGIVIYCSDEGICGGD